MVRLKGVLDGRTVTVTVPVRAIGVKVGVREDAADAPDCGAVPSSSMPAQ